MNDDSLSPEEKLKRLRSALRLSVTLLIALIAVGVMPMALPGVFNQPRMLMVQRIIFALLLTGLAINFVRSRRQT